MAISRVALRGAAVAIAVAGVADPVLSITRMTPVEVGVVPLVSPAHAGAARDAIDALARALGGRARVSLRATSTPALACPPGGPCVVVADGSRPVAIPMDQRGQTSLIVVPAPSNPDVAVLRVTTTDRQHALASGAMQVVMEGRGVAGRQTDLRVLDGNAVVGRGVYRWPADGRADVRVSWWPVADGPRTLRVEAASTEGEANVVNNAAELAVWVTKDRLPVLVFEPRPSWASTFVRRALEADARVAVDARARVAPGVTVGGGAAQLDAGALQRASAVVVGGLDALTDADVERLDRYVRVRGGTLVLVPDQRPTGSAARLLPGEWTERLSAVADRVATLQATETLRLAAAGPLDAVLGAIEGAPVIVMTPVGEGHTVVSGAMDAWRFRADGGAAFARFWQGLVVETAVRGQELTVAAEALAAVGGPVAVEVRWRRMQPAERAEAGATLRCGEEAPAPLRLWPSGQPGVFGASWTAGLEGPCVVEATTNSGVRAAAGLVVSSSPQPGQGDSLSRLQSLVAATGGVRAAAGDEARVASHVLAASPSAPAPMPVHPMRSPWWMLPFVLCLGGEWWLRRRAGLR